MEFFFYVVAALLAGKFENLDFPQTIQSGRIVDERFFLRGNDTWMFFSPFCTQGYFRAQVGTVITSPNEIEEAANRVEYALGIIKSQERNIGNRGVARNFFLEWNLLNSGRDLVKLIDESITRIVASLQDGFVTQAGTTVSDDGSLGRHQAKKDRHLTEEGKMEICRRLL